MGNYFLLGAKILGDSRALLAQERTLWGFRRQRPLRAPPSPVALRHSYTKQGSPSDCLVPSNLKSLLNTQSGHHQPIVIVHIGIAVRVAVEGHAPSAAINLGGRRAEKIPTAIRFDAM